MDTRPIATLFCALAVSALSLPALAQTSPVPSSAPSAAPAAPAAAAPADYDVFAYILSDGQRKTLDRDPRCHDARSAADSFVASAGKELQVGVDAMAALEKCAVLSRVGDDWADFRDYVITAAAAVAYRVGASAENEQLLKRSADDASHVTGFDASSATVQVYTAGTNASQILNSNDGHRMGEGPRQSSMKYRGESKEVSAYSGTYGRIATDIARASNTRLQTIAAVHPQAH